MTYNLPLDFERLGFNRKDHISKYKDSMGIYKREIYTGVPG